MPLPGTVPRNLLGCNPEWRVEECCVQFAGFGQQLTVCEHHTVPERSMYFDPDPGGISLVNVNDQGAW